MNDICIFTPTYNRAYRLPGLFESLKHQECDNFCWLIVDDGSSDDTEALVQGFKKSSPFPIHYIRQDNGGRHVPITPESSIAIANCSSASTLMTN